MVTPQVLDDNKSGNGQPERKSLYVFSTYGTYDTINEDSGTNLYPDYKEKRGPVNYLY